MNNKEVADEVMKRLSKWNPSIWHEATTGSIYVKFPHWRLGSIRIGDHKGRSKYHYRWQIRPDISEPKIQVGTKKFMYRPEALEDFYRLFEWFANKFNVKPGDKQLWEEYKNIPTPKWKEKKYIERSLK